MNFALCLLVGAIDTTARADDGWLLTTADFRTERVSLRAFGEKGATVLDSEGNARLVALDRLLQIQRIAPPPASTAKFILVLWSGDRLGGEPRAIEGESLLWSGVLGEIPIPLNQVAVIHRENQVNDENRRRETDDIVTLSNGDLIRGIISSLSEKSVGVQTPAGEVVQAPLASVASIHFAAAPGTENQFPPHRAFRASLSDGSIVTVPIVRITDDGVELLLDEGTSHPVHLTDVISIEQMNGPVIWLSSLLPTQNVQVPFLDHSAPARMNQSVTGRSIRFGERTFARGVGVHSYSRMVWDIDPAAKVFRTQYAIDGDLPYADLTVRIKLEDRVVHEKTNVRAGVLSPVVMVEIGGAKSITLEADYGQTYDVQDRLNWIEPALLKVRPEPPTPSPATIPSTTTPSAQ